MNAELFGRIYATVTVNVDSPAGWPSTAPMAPKPPAAAQGCKLREFGRFAIDPTARSKRLIISLIHLLYIYAHRVRAAPTSLIEINPRHRAFYERLLEFEQLGSERMCERVNAPAILMHLSCAKIERRLRRSVANGASCLTKIGLQVRAEPRRRPSWSRASITERHRAPGAGVA